MVPTGYFFSKVSKGFSCVNLCEIATLLFSLSISVITQFISSPTLNNFFAERFFLVQLQEIIDIKFVIASIGLTGCSSNLLRSSIQSSWLSNLRHDYLPRPQLCIVMQQDISNTLLVRRDHARTREQSASIDELVLEMNIDAVQQRCCCYRG